jgi:hypothetical protein
VVGERLAVAGMAVAYGAMDLPSQGPLVVDLKTVSNTVSMLCLLNPSIASLKMATSG